MLNLDQVRHLGDFLNAPEAASDALFAGIALDIVGGRDLSGFFACACCTHGFLPSLFDPVKYRFSSDSLFQSELTTSPFPSRKDEVVDKSQFSAMRNAL